MRITTRWFAIVMVAAGILSAACTVEGEDSPPESAATDDNPFLEFEGETLGPLDASGASEVIEVEPFERLGLLWDSPAANAFELRTSPDGERWSEWTAPEIGSSDEGAHSGYLDVDAPARFFQYRVLDFAPPTYLAVEPKETIPPPMWTGSTSLADTADQDDLDLQEVPEPGTLQFTVKTGIGSLTVHPRSEWGARAPKCVAWTSPTRATIHHTVTPTNDSMSVTARLRQIQAYHMFTNGWCDIGYNFLVSRDGRVWRGRGSQHLGAHTANANTGNVGVSFIGTYTSTSASSTQKCNAAKLLRWLHNRFPALHLDRSDVKGHRQIGTTATACPGNALYNQIDGIVQMSKQGC